MRTQWLSSIDELRAGEWDRLTRSSDLFLSTDWLEITASSDPEMSAPPSYLVCREGSRITAGLPVYTLSAAVTPDPLARVDLVLGERLRDQPPPEGSKDWSEALMPSLMCGGWAPFGSTVLSGAERGQAVDAVLAELGEFARAQGARSIGFLYVGDDDAELRASLRRAGYLAVPAMSRMTMDLPWQSFDGYLGSLSKGRRANVRRELRMLSDLTFDRARLTAGDIPDFTRLSVGTASKYDDHVSADEVSRWLLNLAEQSLIPIDVITARRGSDLYGFMVAVLWRDALYTQHAGFDYELCGSLPVYFGTVFYEAIHLGIERGIDHIEYSVGSEDTKASRGCRRNPQWTYVRALDPETQKRLTAVVE